MLATKVFTKQPPKQLLRVELEKSPILLSNSTRNLISGVAYKKNKVYRFFSSKLLWSLRFFRSPVIQVIKSMPKSTLITKFRVPEVSFSNIIVLSTYG